MPSSRQDRQETSGRLRNPVTINRNVWVWENPPAVYFLRSGASDKGGVQFYENDVRFVGKKRQIGVPELLGVEPFQLSRPISHLFWSLALVSFCLFFAANMPQDILQFGRGGILIIQPLVVGLVASIAFWLAGGRYQKWVQVTFPVRANQNPCGLSLLR